MAYSVDLDWLALTVAIRSVHLPVTPVRNRIAVLPEISGARLVGNLRKHTHFFAAFDLPECVTAKLKVVALLVNGITTATLNQNAVIDTGN